MRAERSADSGAGGEGDTGLPAGRKKPPKKTPARKAKQEVARKTFPIVGIGASAGGLEAFADLLENLPPDTGMSFVLVQHLAPTHKTILPEILSRSTSMPVKLATDGVRLAPNKVYVCPPGQDIGILDGSLNLTERELVAGLHLPVDHFMRSLAADQKSRSIGVVLSGSASDGALGMAAIKAEGGITFAQEPSSARYDGMPTAAIRANAADMVLETAEIARELARLGKHPYVLREQAEEAVAAASEVAETETDWMNKVFVLLRTVFGVDFSTYRVSTIRRRIDRRMALYRLDSLKDYVAYLRERPAEVEDLYHDILIMVTEFFREPEAFEALTAKVLPEIIAGKRENEQLRIWVPGCSTGEEPYSIALTVVHALQQAGRDLPIKIFATDISERDIEQARMGIFPENKYTRVPEEYRHFFGRADGGHQVAKSIRDLVIFARHDVTADPPFSQLDLISCRNLLIYLGASAQERVIPTFHYALRPQGYLLLGGSESIGGATDLFAPVDKKLKIFVKKPSARRIPALASMPAYRQESPAAGYEALAGFERRFDPQHAAEEILLNEFAPPAVVIDDEFEIMQFRGGTDDFLQHATGRASLNALEMAREGLAAEMRKAVDKSRVSNKSVQRDPVRYRSGNELREVSVQAIPFKGNAGERYYVVLFRKAHDAAVRPLQTSGGEQAGDEPELAHLRRELDATRDYMQALVQDKEAALEELRAASEEVQSSNEELQSMNEELETAKEELQSTNEELRTVNEELENRNLQLTRANDDLNNLLRAVDVPTIMVGRDLRIRRFTPGTERVMNLIASDIGRPITDIALRLDVPDLDAMLQQAIENIAVAEREIVDEHGHWYSMRVRPYQTDQNRIEGAVITLFDVDELRRTLAKSRQSAELNAGVNKVLSALQADQALERAMLVLLAEGTTAAGAEAAAVLLREDGGWVVRHAHNVAPGVPGRRFSDDEIPQAAIAESTRAPVSVRGGDGSSRLLPDGFGDSAGVVVPLIGGGDVFGALLVAWRGADGAPDDAQVDFVAKIAALTSLALTGAPR